MYCKRKLSELQILKIERENTDFLNKIFREPKKTEPMTPNQFQQSEAKFQTLVKVETQGFSPKLEYQKDCKVVDSFLTTSKTKGPLSVQKALCPTFSVKKIFQQDRILDRLTQRSFKSTIQRIFLCSDQKQPEIQDHVLDEVLHVNTAHEFVLKSNLENGESSDEGENYDNDSEKQNRPPSDYEGDEYLDSDWDEDWQEEETDEPENVGINPKMSESMRKLIHGEKFRLERILQVDQPEATNILALNINVQKKEENIKNLR